MNAFVRFNKGILIKVLASGINRLDNYIREGSAIPAQIGRPSGLWLIWEGSRCMVSSEPCLSSWP
jgi:hypothetical protein